MIKAVFVALLMCVAWGRAEAQSDSEPIRGPVLGFAFDELKDLRPILGIAGAATVGEPIAINFRFSGAVLAPGQKYAIGTNVESAEVLVLMLDGLRFQTVPISGALANPDAIAFSPNASSAALYSEPRRMVQIVTGLPDSPRMLGEFDLSAISGSLRSLTVSDPILRDSLTADERDRPGFRAKPVSRRVEMPTPILVLAFSDETSNSLASTLYVLDAENELKQLSYSGSISAVTFLPNAPDVVVLDSINNQVAALRDVVGSNSVEVLADVDDGIQKPTAIAVSSDGRRGFVINDSSDIAVLDFANRAVSVVSCPCLPSHIAQLATNVFFGLTQRLDKPIWVLDGRNETINFVFVPAYVR